MYEAATANPLPTANLKVTSPMHSEQHAERLQERDKAEDVYLLLLRPAVGQQLTAESRQLTQ
jgi:hypothetical protein